MVSEMTKTEVSSLREAYRKHVQHPDGHWKGRAVAVVDPEIKHLVWRSMDFHGSLVDHSYVDQNGKVVLISDGYWAHGF